MYLVPQSLQHIQKLIIALIGAIAVAVSLGLLPEVAGDWLAVASAFFASLGVYVLPNAPQQERDALGRFKADDRGQGVIQILLAILLIIVIVMLLRGRL